MPALRHANQLPFVWWLRLDIAIERIRPGHPHGASPRPYRGLTQLEYPFHDRTITVTRADAPLARQAGTGGAAKSYIESMTRDQLRALVEALFDLPFT